MLVFACILSFFLVKLGIILGMKYTHYPRIRDTREDRDLTQDFVAKLIKTNRTTYGHYENGERLIPIDKLHILADFYGTSVDYLMGRTREFKPYPPA